MSQYMYTSIAPLPPVFSRIESSRPKTAASPSPSSSSSLSTTTITTATTSAAVNTKPVTDSATSPTSSTSAATPPTPSSSTFPSTAKSAGSHHPPLSRLNYRNFSQRHPSVRLQHIRTSSSSSASRSSHETSTTTPTSTGSFIPQAASPTDSRTPASPTSPKRSKHKHHHSLQNAHGAAADRPSHTRAPPRLRKESGSLSSYARLAFQPPSSPRVGLTLNELKHVAMLVDTDSSGRHLAAPKASGLPFSRTESLSSAAPSTTSLSARTMTSSDPTFSFDASRPYALRNGRTYLSDPSLAYPLPVDLQEIHRQSLRTLMLTQVFGAPICSNSFSESPPGRVLEVACGSGFWSQSCHQYFAQRGHSDIEFTGMDIAPMGANAGDVSREMKWNFVQHDMRHFPWPFADGEFDLVMVKDLSLVVTSPHSLQAAIEEYHRILRPGGTVEFWDSDHQIRMLRPHAGPQSSESEETGSVAALGAYPISGKTPLSAPLNNFLVEYNGWVHRALEARNLSPVPCTLIGPMLLQESEELTDIHNKRLAIPLSEVRWEREGVGGVVTKDGKSFIKSGKGKGKDRDRPDEQKKTLTEAQTALRRTALMTVVQQIQSLEPILREVSGKSQDEWDGWMGKMMNDLMRENGTSWGECLEVGAWWARKRER
ncbi:methyltransferase domain-containing protein [Colletotrichum graminicola]|uniref:Methyltransferase domain-containing protein n=1 Tax=Colletotrichum graminicola (strain M1.001 / M2 / FGSC 10212) TaxID=645133 RepID=E3Q5L8_COLGM|nr:methyltransferase domain-containing protein [Colletotrichum graminicola M1.001]EFQ25985.1 methyltransferase domain-containing protein [Colletotrichum graminicola M1.001]WDK23108.1 methyltransferase domain-containing protein [Colletotrichum graminicola]